MAAPPVDYYAALDIDPRATQQEVRAAYKRAALRHHPDRVAADSPERGARTRRFQLINDAYYTLSDAARRRDYDSARAFHGPGASPPFAESDEAADEEFAHDSRGTGAGAMPGGFPWSAFGFSGAPAGTTDEAHDSFAHAQFGTAFEEMLREEGMAAGDEGGGTRAAPTSKFWSIVGGLSGGAMGFIVANFPGMVAGAVAGNRLGNVRDTKGKSVYDVFQELPQADKARLLSDLAAKVFAQAVGS